MDIYFVLDCKNQRGETKSFCTSETDLLKTMLDLHNTGWIIEVIRKA